MPICCSPATTAADSLGAMAAMRSEKKVGVTWRVGDCSGGGVRQERVALGEGFLCVRARLECRPALAQGLGQHTHTRSSTTLRPPMEHIAWCFHPASVATTTATAATPS